MTQYFVKITVISIITETTSPSQETI